MRGVLLLSAAILAGGAASSTPSPDDALRALAAEDARVAAVGYRLMIASTELCPARGPQSGIELQDALEYGPADRPAAMRVFGLGGAPGVLAVAPGSPAEAAGVRPGDTLLAVGEIGFSIVPPASDAPATEAGADGARNRLDTALAQGPARLELQREGRTFEVVVTAPEGCAYRFQVFPSPDRSASSNGRTVLVSSALTRYAERDENLALVLGHEMAHSVLGHPAHPTGSSRQREQAADYLGLYLTARAGYDISGASGFWRRFGADDWRASWGLFSHPSAAARARALAAATAEIEAKRAAGNPLLPGASPPR